MCVLHCPGLKNIDRKLLTILSLTKTSLAPVSITLVTVSIMLISIMLVPVRIMLAPVSRIAENYAVQAIIVHQLLQSLLE